MAPTGKHITIYLTEEEKAFVAAHSPGWIRRVVQAQMAYDAQKKAKETGDLSPLAVE